jgi:PBSX family phage terminase large subunit
MVRKMKEDVPESIFETVKQVIEWWGLGAYFRIYEGTHKIVCTLNGNSFIKKGLNQVSTKSGNAKSITNPTDAIIDEADEITLEEYIKLTGSLRGSKEIEEILIFNPPESDHWIIKRWFPKDITSFELPDGSHTYIDSIIDNCTILHTTYKHNPFINSSEKEFYTTLEITNPDLYKTDGLGLLVATRTGGEAIKNFDLVKHVTTDKLFRNDIRVLACWDFNRRPHHTVGMWQFWHDSINNIFFMALTKEFTLEETKIRDVQKEINKWLKEEDYDPTTVRLIGDHQGTKEMDYDAETFMSIIEREIKRGGYKVINETKSNPRVVSSLEFLNDIFGGYIFLAEDSGYENCKIQIIVQADCKFHIADFAKTKVGKDGKLLKIEKSEVVRDGSTTKVVKYQIRGHGVDEARYAAVGVFEEEYRLYRKKD